MKTLLLTFSTALFSMSSMAFATPSRCEMGARLVEPNMRLAKLPTNSQAASYI